MRARMSILALFLGTTSARLERYRTNV